MGRVTAVAAAIAGLAGTTGALLMPWAQYGGVDVGLVSFPAWGWYVSSAVLLQLCVVWTLLAGVRQVAAAYQDVPRIIGLVCGASATVSAVVVLLHYDDATALFGPAVPPIEPVLGPGGPVAIAAALLGAGVLLFSRRR